MPSQLPVCALCQIGNTSQVLETVNGVARCPYDPRHNSTAMVTERGELYAATVIDFSGRDPVIYRSLGNMPPLRTAQYNSKWLNGNAAHRFVLICSPAEITSSPTLLCSVSRRASFCLRARDRPLRLLLPERNCGRKRLREGGVLSRGAGLQERHGRALPVGGHVDHLHEGPTQLLTLGGDPLLLQRAAEHLLPPGTGADLRHLHHQRVSDAR